jgi:hypothetical protein
MYLTMPQFFSSSANAFLKGVGVLGVGSERQRLTLLGVEWSRSQFLLMWSGFPGCNGKEFGVTRRSGLFSFSSACWKGVDCAVTVHRRRGVADKSTLKDRFGLFKNCKQNTMQHLFNVPYFKLLSPLTFNFNYSMSVMSMFSPINIFLCFDKYTAFPKKPRLRFHCNSNSTQYH